MAYVDCAKNSVVTAVQKYYGKEARAFYVQALRPHSSNMTAGNIEGYSDFLLPRKPGPVHRMNKNAAPYALTKDFIDRSPFNRWRSASAPAAGDEGNLLSNTWHQQFLSSPERHFTPPPAEC